MTIIHFTAEWCQPCKAMKPIVQAVVQERDDLSYMAIDVDEDPEQMVKYEVRSVPTFILLNDDGTVIGRAIGAQPKQKFLDSLGL